MPERWTVSRPIAWGFVCMRPSVFVLGHRSTFLRPHRRHVSVRKLKNVFYVFCKQVARVNLIIYVLRLQKAKLSITEFLKSRHHFRDLEVSLYVYWLVLPPSSVQNFLHHNHIREIITQLNTFKILYGISPFERIATDHIPEILWCKCTIGHS